MRRVPKEPEISLEPFAANLRKQRKRKQRKLAGLSQEALGFERNLHRTEISLLERSGREPGLRTLVRLSRALRVPVTALLDGIS